MPNLHSALKRVHLAEKSRRKNRSTKAAISTVRRNMFTIVSEKDKEKARQTYRQYCSVLDRAAKKGVIKKNMAVRRKRRAALKLAVLEKAG